MATRPTSDRLRETLFNVLASRIEGAAFLDLYAGSGAVGLEALSRGAARVECVERAQAAREILRANARKLGVEGELRLFSGSVAAYLAQASGPWNIVFLDPPYEAAEEYEATLESIGRGESAPRSPSARDRGYPILVPRSQNRDPSTGSGQARGHPGSFLSAGAVVVAEHRRKEKLEERYGALERTRELEQGDAALSFYALSE
jgi:16S rRNA (guanine966-N2)-methyltransferase